MKQAVFIMAAALALVPIAAESPQVQNRSIAPAAAREILTGDRSAVLLDVRTAEEFASGRIEGSVLFPYDEITAATAAKLIQTKETAVIVYCRSGRRSAIAAQKLLELGYANVRDLGGINQWPYGTVK